MSIQADPLKARGSDIAMLSDTLRRGGSALESVPHQIKQILADDTWRHFVTKLGKEVRHDRFAEFVTTKPLAGLGASVELVERLVGDDDDATRRLRKALKGTRNNITSKRGTRRDYSLERLERDAPGLHADVVAGRLSAHAAMVQAGFRPKTFTVRADSAEAVVKALRRQLDAATLEAVRQLLDPEGAGWTG